MTRREFVRLAAGAVISAVFVIITFRSIDPAQLVEQLSGMHLGLIAAAVLVGLMEVSVRSVRWQALLSPVARISIGTSFAYICIGHFANTLLPLRLGDVARAYLAGSRFHADRVTVFGTIVLERVADGGLLLAVVLSAALGGLTISGLPPTGLAAVAGIGLAILGVALVLQQTALRWLANRAPQLHAYVNAFMRSFESLRTQGKIGVVTLTTALSLLGATAILELVLQAAGVVLPFWTAAVAISAMTLSTAIPAAPAAIGTYEFVGTALLAAFGVAPHSALAAVIVVHVIATLPPAAIGLVATLVLHLDVLSLRTGRQPKRNRTLRIPDPV